MADLDVDDPRAVPIRGRIVREKVFLRRIYEEWYAMIAGAMPPGEDPILELGSGGGFLETWLPGLLTSDVFPCPGVRVALDGRALPLGRSSLRAIVMTDVLHHIPQSRQFFAEAARCVRPCGRLVMIEPWVTPWSSFVYSRLHPEPFVPDAVDWEFPAGGPLSAANTALPWIIFLRDLKRFEREFPEWRLVVLRPLMPFRYLLSGGVSARGLTPAWTFGLWRGIERLIQPWSHRFGMFAHVVLERTDVERS
jgi:SAM-dependent methyltransferase